MEAAVKVKHNRDLGQSTPAPNGPIRSTKSGVVSGPVGDADSADAVGGDTNLARLVVEYRPLVARVADHEIVERIACAVEIG